MKYLSSKIKLTAHLFTFLNHEYLPCVFNSHLGSSEFKRRIQKLRKKVDYSIFNYSTIQKYNPQVYVETSPNKKKQPIPILLINDTSNIDLSLNIFQKPHPKVEFACLEPEKHNVKEVPHLHNYSINYFKDMMSFFLMLEKRLQKKIHILIEDSHLFSYIMKYIEIHELYISILPCIMTDSNIEIHSNDININHTLEHKNKWKLKSVFHHRSEVFLRYQSHIPKILKS